MPRDWLHLPQASRYPAAEVGSRSFGLGDLVTWSMELSTKMTFDLGELELNNVSESKILIVHPREGDYLFELVLMSDQVPIDAMKHSQLTRLDEFDRIEYEDYIKPSIESTREKAISTLKTVELGFELEDSCGYVSTKGNLSLKSFERLDNASGWLYQGQKGIFNYKIAVYSHDEKAAVWTLRSRCIYKINLKTLKPASDFPEEIKVRAALILPGTLELSQLSTIYHLKQK